ncbi:MAG: recombinase family protein, partial [Methylococcaceae bacterium]
MTSHIGYIRVSSNNQNTDRQLDGITLDKTFTEKQSARTADRPQLQNCLDWIREGDTLHVHSIGVDREFGI